MSLFGNQTERHFSFRFPLDLFACLLIRAIIRHSGTKDTGIRLRKSSYGRLIHLFGRLDIDPFDIRMNYRQRHRSCDQCHFRSLLRTRFRQCKPHLSRRIVTYKTHRIYLFICQTGCYYNLFFFQAGFGKRRNLPGPPQSYQVLPYAPYPPDGWQVPLRQVR